jgi:hypothetical protein
VAFSHSLLERMLGSGTMDDRVGRRARPGDPADLPRVEHSQSVLYELVEADRLRPAAVEEEKPS